MSAQFAAEQAILGALLVGHDWHTASVLSADDFQAESERLIYGAISGVIEDGGDVDIITVAEWLEQAGQLARVGGMEYLGVLAQNSTGAMLPAYVGLLLDHARRRRAHGALMAALKELSAGGDPADVLASAQAALGADQEPGGIPLAAVIDRAAEAALRAQEESRDGTAGAYTGVPFIDDFTGGLRGGRLWVIAGRPGAGKSAFGIQALIHAAKRGVPGALVSLEMGAAETGVRILAQHLGVSATRLSAGRDEEVAELGGPRVAALRSLPVVFDQTAYRISDILQRAGQWQRQHGIKLLVVDYLQRVEGGKGSSRNEEIGDVVRRLKRLSLELDLCVVTIASLNRMSERENRRPVLADLRESGDIEFDADVVIALRRAAVEDTPVYDVEAGIIKNRTGRVGWASAPLQFDARHQTFREIDARYAQVRGR
ncbi:MAG: replicative DNA helicase [Hyphomonadaceae bacterium]